MRSLPFFFGVTISLAIISLMNGCCGGLCMVERSAEQAGGEDQVTVDLPFTAGYTARCVQGVNGAYSHHYNSTMFDVDFDTPNNVDDIIYAPSSGTVYVHESDPTHNFGRHINLDLNDGSYIVLGHMKDIFVSDGSEVAAGQILGYEGTTGYSTGDHVHVGRHSGDAARDAVYGTSLEGLAFNLVDETVGESLTSEATGDMTCDLSAGHYYSSLNSVNRWHPNGSLIKTPADAQVYLLEDGLTRYISGESAFWSRNYSFSEVALVDDDELACYGWGLDVAGSSEVQAVYQSGVVWLLIGQASDGTRQRWHVRSTGWQAVLKSWGITASTYNDLATKPSSGNVTSWPDSGYALFRDGSLVSEVSSSAVYFMSDGIAMPVESWDTFLLMGFGGRAVSEVDNGTVAAVMTRVGDCGTNTYCISHDDVATCGGSSGGEGTYDGEGGVPDSGLDTGYVPQQTDTGSDAPNGSLSVSWTTPGNVLASSIKLSGEYSSGGVAQGWRNYGEVTNAVSATNVFAAAKAGDSWRFSAEYTVGGNTSWSCLAPFPPGTVQGSATAVYNGQPLSVVATADPSSNGCGLTVTVPS
jgi:hypothetical protein